MKSSFAVTSELNYIFYIIKICLLYHSNYNLFIIGYLSFIYISFIISYKVVTLYSYKFSMIETQKTLSKI